VGERRLATFTASLPAKVGAHDELEKGGFGNQSPK